MYNSERDYRRAYINEQLKKHAFPLIVRIIILYMYLNKNLTKYVS